MSSPNFRFKQFTIWHDKCAMKVGTDGVLLGAWCPLNELIMRDTQCTILDVGTGSGLIAIMLAQRLCDKGGQDFTIDAIDVNDSAAAQAQANCDVSPWKKHLRVWHTSLQDFEAQKESYNLIVSNPPYFVDSLKNPDKGRETARHTDSLSDEELLSKSAQLLTQSGHLALIVPAAKETAILHLAKAYGLTLCRQTEVYSKPDKEQPLRVMLDFVKDIKNHVEPTTDRLNIESAHSPRSEEYVELTKAFYL